MLFRVWPNVALLCVAEKCFQRIESCSIFLATVAVKIKETDSFTTSPWLHTPVYDSSDKTPISTDQENVRFGLAGRVPETKL